MNKLFKEIREIIEKNLIDIMHPSRYELVCVGYNAVPKGNEGPTIYKIAQNTIGFRNHKSLLNYIRKKEEKGLLLDDGWIDGNKYYIALNVKELDTDRWDIEINPYHKSHFQESYKLGQPSEKSLEELGILNQEFKGF